MEADTAKGNPSPTKQNDFGVFLVAVLGSVSVLILIYAAADKLNTRFQNINDLITNHPKSFPEGAIRDLDPLLDEIHREAYAHRYEFGTASTSTSPALRYLRQKTFEGSEVISQRKYESIYCLLKELQAKGDTETELSVLTAWLSRSPEESKVTFGTAHDFFSYVDSFYLVPLDHALSRDRFAEAKWLSGEAVRRLDLIDTTFIADTGLREEKNKALLYEVLLRDPKLVYQQASEVRILYQIVHDDFPDEMVKELDSLVDPKLVPYKDYWAGIYEFRKQNYSAARETFRKVSTADNDELRQLSYLMQARCIFWDPTQIPENFKLTVPDVPETITIQRNESGSLITEDPDEHEKTFNRYFESPVVAAATRELRTLRTKVSSKYLTDIDYYIRELEKSKR